MNSLSLGPAVLATTYTVPSPAGTFFPLRNSSNTLIQTSAFVLVASTGRAGRCIATIAHGLSFFCKPIVASANSKPYDKQSAPHLHTSHANDSFRFP
ncbi:hypothetical protein P4H42_24915 [Paenibacillus macerans]|uniref:hypothetical protein n=1 Tax=Paenibacillus macerans TaxID=44252 RepID=UPI002DB59526|nr:hypothetical protein [Paenibacillus macerans]MEC0332826.1 hypothetical protein [Paenibacillus macerans]